MNKIIKSLILIVSIFTLSVIFTNQTEARSKTTIKTIKTYKTPKPFLKNTNEKVTLWNKNHTKKIKTLSTIPKKTLYATKLVAVRFPNYQYNVNYYYIKSKDNQIKGYIWHKALTSASYVNNGKYSYYSYPKNNILASTNSAFKDYQHQLVDDVGVMDFADNANLTDVTKTPSTKDIKTVFSFFSNPKNTNKIPNVYPGFKKYKVRRVRIVQSTMTSNTYKKAVIPMLQLGSKINGDIYYNNKMNFWTALEFAKLNGIPEQKFSDKDSKIHFVTDGIGFYFPYSDEIQKSAENNIMKIYKSGYGTHKNLTLIQDGIKTLRYVKTDSITSMARNKFELKNKIWFGTLRDPKEIKLKADPKKSKTYRCLYGDTFVEFKFINNKWVEQFFVYFKNISKTHSMDIIRVSDTSSKLITNLGYYQDFTPYIYKPSSFYN